MLDLSVIVLTGNEELHIERCLQNLVGLASDVFVVDSFSTDRTRELVESFLCGKGKGSRIHFVQREWPGLYAPQFNWALSNLPIHTKWVLRLDADEYMKDELVQEIQQKLNRLDEDVTGVVFKRRHIFLGKWMKKGTYPVKLLRLFQYKKGICEQRMMDEHIRLLDGRAIEFEGDFCDHNLNDLSWWSQKHVGYAIREAADLLDTEYGLIQRDEDEEQLGIGAQAAVKRVKKMKYARLPMFWRSFAYFCLRYFIKGGFIEGKEGFLWHFLQGWWYRTLVDAKIFEIKRRAVQKGGVTAENVLCVLREEYGMKI